MGVQKGYSAEQLEDPISQKCLKAVEGNLDQDEDSDDWNINSMKENKKPQVSSEKIALLF